MKRLAVCVGFFVACCVGVLPVGAQGDSWGNIKGRVLWGPEALPVPMVIQKVNDNSDKAHCLQKGPLKDENWVVDKDSRGLRWVILWLINDDPKDKKAIPIHPKLAAVPKEPVYVDQPICAFIPHALAMRAGQVLVTKNSSTVPHNIKWTGSKNMGNVTVPPGGELKIKDLQAERLPMPIECNFHPWMNGRVGIFDHPYFAVTDKDGNFEIKDAPAGKYRLVLHNGVFNGGAAGRFGQPIEIPAGKTADLGKIEFTPPKE